MEPHRFEAEQNAIIRILRQIEDQDSRCFIRYNVVVSGTAAMVLSGIDRDKQIGDIDLFVTTQLWMDLLASGEWSVYIPPQMNEKRRHDPPFLYKKVAWDVGERDTIEVSIFFDWRDRSWGNISVKELFNQAVEKEKILCVGMRWLLNWKEEVHRPKDIPDIDLIKEHME